MKTAISLPDQLFHRADQKAKKLGMSRSEFYSRAIELLVDTYDKRKVMQELDRIYSESELQSIDSGLLSMQAQSIPADPW